MNTKDQKRLADICKGLQIDLDAVENIIEIQFSGFKEKIKKYQKKYCNPCDVFATAFIEYCEETLKSEFNYEC